MCACRTPLHAAAFAEDVAGLQLVLRYGAEINTVDKSGRSALMVAADKGHSGTVGKPLDWICIEVPNRRLFIVIIGLNRSVVRLIASC